MQGSPSAAPPLAAPRPPPPHPAPWLAPVTPDVRRRIEVIQKEWQRIDPKYLDEDEQRYWATIAGRQIRFDERASFVQKLTDRNASKVALEQFLATARPRTEPAVADDGAAGPSRCASSAPTSTISSRS